MQSDSTEGDAKPAGMSNLAQRLIVAAIGIPVLLMVIITGSTTYSAVVALTALAAVREFTRIARSAGARPNTLILPAGVALYVINATQQEAAAPAITGLVFTAAIAWGAFRPRDPLAISNVVWTIVGTLYAGFLFSHWLVLRQIPQGMEWTLLALFGTFANDTAAYAVGRLIGRHKMAPSISPGKTWEGAAGALVATSLAVPALATALGLPLTEPMWLLGPGLSVAAQAGDLAESKLKRLGNVKDSGAMFPGHGGLLDRLDALVFVGPLVYYWSIWVSPLP